MIKNIYINDKGYGGLTEEFKKDSEDIDIKIKEIFDSLIKKGYRPSEICLEIISTANYRYSIYSIEKGLADRKRERKIK